LTAPAPADNAAALADDVVATLRRRGETLAVAESVTGGLVAATLVGVPGASEVFRGGVVAYATDLKADWVDVPNALLAASGPVHPDVALRLAVGVRARAGADWGLGITGVAGPDPVGEHPVGEVWVGLAGPPGEWVTGLRFAGGRHAVRSAAVIGALDALKVRLGSHEKIGE
jgi:nicotinamide-nucleotide amidase